MKHGGIPHPNSKKVQPKSAQQWCANYDRMREPPACEHGHFECSCSSIPGGPCHDEMLHLIDDEAEAAKAEAAVVNNPDPIAISPSTDETYESIEAEIERITDECWKLHNRLAQPYDSRYKQLDDMIELGKLAQDVKTLTTAREVVARASRRRLLKR